MIVHRRLPVLLVAGLFLLLPSTGEAAIPPSERAALIALYDSTSGPTWNYSWNWLGPVGTECSWDGVWCDAADTTVAYIFMNYNNLSGPLPPEIGNLTGLQVLDLTENFITGAIPPEIGNLNQLAVLSLFRNRLTGPIPAEIGGLTSLGNLDLGENQLTGAIPTELGNLVNLSSLYLGNNDLSGPLPTSLGNLTGLQTLYLQSNRLSGEIPAAVEGMTALRRLLLADNDFTGTVPHELIAIQTLWELDLTLNRLGGQIPPALGNHPNLHTLKLGANKFEGEIPATLGIYCDGGGSLRISGNALFTTDPVLIAQLDACQYYWRNQTEPPTEVALAAPASSFATLNWTPVSDGEYGTYETFVSAGPDGPWERVAATAIVGDESVTFGIIGPLEPATTYNARVRVTKYPHPYNKNTVVSRASAEIQFTTVPAETFYAATSGDDLNDCLSETTPCLTIQAAVDKASTGDTVVAAPGIYQENLVIDRDLVIRGSKSSPTIVDGGGAGSTVSFECGPTAALEDLHITNGHASLGGGVFNGGGTLFVLGCEISGNTAVFDGGGISNAGGILIVEESAIIGNTAGSDAAIAIQPVPMEGITAGLRNSTVSGNISTDAFSRVLGPSQLMNCTVAENRAGIFGFVLAAEDNKMQHTIIAENASPNCVDRSITSLGNNLSDTDTCFADHHARRDRIVPDVGLGPLAFHGGTTRSHLLIPGSPAIDTGDNDGAPQRDQRGAGRPFDGDGDGDAVIDIGAHETGSDASTLFLDDFESGDTTAWSSG